MRFAKWYIFFLLHRPFTPSRPSTLLYHLYSFPLHHIGIHHLACTLLLDLPLSYTIT